MTMRVPATLISKTRSPAPARIDVEPATWKTRSTPFIARRTARRSVMSPVARSNSSSARWLEVGPAPGEQPQLVAALGQRANEVAADEAGSAGYKRLRHAEIYGGRQALTDRTAHMAERRTEVVCDTTCYLPAELVAERGIHRISLYVGIEGELEPEPEITDYDEFYERLRAAEAKATTSQPSVGDFVSV